MDLVQFFCIFRFSNILFLFSELDYKQGFFKRVQICGFCTQLFFTITSCFTSLRFLSSSSDLVHIMKITSMNYKKRMDLSLIRELMDFFSNFDMYMLACASAKTFPIVQLFRVEVSINDRITACGACLNFTP